MTDADIGQLKDTQEWYAAAGHDTEYADSSPDRYDDEDDDPCRCVTFMAGGMAITDITDCPVHDVATDGDMESIWNALEAR